MYLYETHLHTSQSSKCGRSAGSEYIPKYIDMGYTGVFVTDHFYGGNTAIDKTLPWRRFAEEFYRGYEDAREAGGRLGLDVFFGWEEHFDGDEYLVYGPDIDWIAERPYMRRWSRASQFREVGGAGGCVVQAHPFRARDYIGRIRLSPKFAHGVEVANSANFMEEDVLALGYARRYGLTATAGSDIHEAGRRVGEDAFGVWLPERISRPRDFARLVREGRVAGLKVPSERFEGTGLERPALPVAMNRR